MSQYRAQLQAALAGKRMEIKERAMRAQALQVDLHMACSPHLPVDQLQVAAIEATARGLRKLVEEIRKLSAEVRRIEDDLGIEDAG